MSSRRSVSVRARSVSRRAVAATVLAALVLAQTTPSFATPTTGDRGNEGERPVGMLDPFFWENGNLFCDRGLKATGFRVLPDMTIQGTNLSRETLEALLAFQVRGEELKEKAQGLGVGDFLGWRWWGPAYLYLPDWDKDGWTLVTDAADFTEDLANLVETLPGFMQDILGAVPNLPLDPGDWDDFDIFNLGSFEDAFDSFQSFFDGTFFDNLSNLMGDFVEPPATAECVNDTRRQAAAEDFMNTWTYWALRNQRKQLQADVPVTKVCWIGAHNAFNNHADGYIAPNNWYSITDQLRAGMRFLALDVYHGADWPCGCSLAQLSHAGDYPTGALYSDRFYYNAIKEIRNWMLLPENLDEVLWIEMQDGVPDDCWCHVNDPIREYLAEEPDIGVFTPADYAAYRDGGGFPTQRELLAMGCRTICIAWNSDFGGEYVHLKPGICANKYGRKWEEFDATVWPPEIAGVPVHPESEILGEIAGNRLVLIGGNVSPITWYRLSELVLYNVNFIGMDMVLNADEDTAPGDRLKGGVWSWREDEWETNGVGQAAMMASDGRWGPRDPASVCRFAASRPVLEVLSGSSEDPLDEETVTTYEWVVTEAAGTWYEGGRTVLEEFGNEYTFAVPVNAYQNAQLEEANGEGADLWLNYSDLRTDGLWEINGPPVAAIAGSVSSDEGLEVAFSAAGSSDPDGDTLVSYEWTFGNEEGATGVYVTTVYGDNHMPALAKLTVTDALGAVGQAVFPITVFNQNPEVTLNTDDAVDFASGTAFLDRLGEANSHSASATDPGSDDLTFMWSLDDLVFANSWVNQENTYFNNGLTPDPLPSSPGTFPFAADDTADNVTFNAPGVYQLNIRVTDDDGGTDARDFPMLVMGAERYAKGAGYWRQYFRAKIRSEEEEKTLQRYLAFVEHASGVFPEVLPAATSADARAILRPGGADLGDSRPTNAKGRLAQEIFRAWLNLASGAIGWEDGPDQECLQTIYESEQVLLDPSSTYQDYSSETRTLRALSRKSGASNTSALASLIRLLMLLFSGWSQ